MKNKKAYRNYRGVKIYRVQRMISGSDFDITNDGKMINKSPKFDIYYRYADGPLHDTLKECQIDIDGMINVSEKFNGQVLMVEELNNGNDVD